MSSRGEAPATKNLWSWSTTVLPQAPTVAALAMPVIATCLLGCACPPLNAFTGRVVDQHDRPVAGLPISGPALRLRDLEQVVTDANGMYGWPAAEGRAAGELCAEDPAQPKVGQELQYRANGNMVTCTSRPERYTVPEAGTTKAWCCPRAADLSIQGTVVDGQGLGLNGARASIQIKIDRYAGGGAEEVLLSGDSSVDGAFAAKVDSELQLEGERLFVADEACGSFTLEVSREGCESVSKAIAIGWEPAVEVGSITLVCPGG